MRERQRRSGRVGPLEARSVVSSDRNKMETLLKEQNALARESLAKQEAIAKASQRSAGKNTASEAHYILYFRTEQVYLKSNIVSIKNFRDTLWNNYLVA